MKVLVIAEKPSVARDIARVLGCKKNGQGMIEGEKYIITWGLGHLVTLADPEEYTPDWKEWKMEVLPMVPKSWKLTVIRQTAKQFGAVKAQIHRRMWERSLLLRMPDGKASWWRDGFLTWQKTKSRSNGCGFRR